MHQLITDKTVKDNNKFNFYIDSRFSNELYVTCCGHAECECKNISKSTNSFPFYSLHYCIKGSGIFVINAKTYNISSGDTFLVFQNTPVQRYSDDTDLWEILWINFSGTQSKALIDSMNFDIDHPIYHINNTETQNALISSYLKLIQSHSMKTLSNLRSLATLFDITSILSEEKGINISPYNIGSSNYIDKALIYIDNNYTKKEFCLTHVAEYLGLHPNYFSKIFHEQTGSCFSAFLRQYRIQKAMELIDNGNYLIKEIAEFVGYTDPLYFSKDFKKIMSFSPKFYTSKHIDNK